ncbi:hypothetical protein [Salinirubrum litoreum]|uniref:Major facilitator superfamily (MFS) profile domain-containing protein n=1 Tax=Salinirubrum litoreum TaxID=1126234 RepID=A0ABD5RFZ5_9EURY|nr:hypothetical protein [Salinirubrum litoreum]
MSALRRATVVVTALGLLAGLLDGGQLALALAGDLGPPNDWVVSATTIGGFVASPLLVAVTGYWVGGLIALSDRYVGLLARFALCGAVSVFVGYLLAFALPRDVSVWRFLPSAAVRLLFASVEVPLYGLAGAAVAHFRR